ncbi:tRNA intron endonuclease [Flagelloscypha sp. PMI_526]|nr:tRNA intron endonuclease [Flagelloscypha sp. PMI_526]
MDSHPSAILSPFLEKYPTTAGSLFQAYNDIIFAQKWKDVELLELQSCSRGVVRGKNPTISPEKFLHVVPCSLTETISLSWLDEAFTGLGNPSEIYLAITSDDASIVYYKISPGFVKPSL